MLRSPTQVEPELLRLCRSGQWLAVSQRSQSHPYEAAPSESALHGHGATVLSLAVRIGAPRDVVQSLLNASFQQIEVLHQRSTILIEALRHRASFEVIECLLQAARHHQGAFQNRIDVLGFRDDLGRTALHYMVERTKESFEKGEVDIGNSHLFRSILQGRPESVHTLDCDGNTPLVLLLLLPEVQDTECRLPIEEEISRMVQLMVSASSWVASISRLLPEPWHDSRCATSDGSPTPLYYAILHGRSLGTIDTLISANRKVGLNACAARITQHREVPLHTAITTRASLQVVARLLEAYPEAVLQADVFGLTPMDWMWIRHVIDWNTENTSSVALVSRGRHLSRLFLDWHGEVSRDLIHNEFDIHLSRTPLKQVTNNLVDLMELLLSTASAVATHDATSTHSLINAACIVPCPLAMVSLAVDQSDQGALQTPDARHRRLPLHWAASRLGYAGNFPVGFTQHIQRVVEPSAVPLLVSRFPAACAVADGHGQLPLHIALDAARHFREIALVSPTQARLTVEEVNTTEGEVLSVLVTTYPDSLEQTDCKTGLLPFQLAAVGPGARLDTIYVLLRQLPSLLGVEARPNALVPMLLET
jgi:hypothetical protein